LSPASRAVLDSRTGIQENGHMATKKKAAKKTTKKKAAKK
jgi:hypothetical protein